MPPTVLALLSDDGADHSPVLVVHGELDVGTAPALRAWLSAATDDGRRSTIVDLSAVTFMAAAALHALCDEQERLFERSQRLTVVCQHPQLLALFRLIELDGVLEVVATRSAARARRPAIRPNQHLAGWVARVEDDLPPKAG